MNPFQYRIGHEFIKYPIETEYGITAKPSTLENPMSNTILERIHQGLGNLVHIFNISNVIQLQDSDINHELSQNYVAI